MASADGVPAPVVVHAMRARDKSSGDRHATHRPRDPRPPDELTERFESSAAATRPLVWPERSRRSLRSRASAP